MQCAASQRNENGSTSLLSRGDRLQQCDFFQHRHELPATNSSNSASKNYSRFKLQMNPNALVAIVDSSSSSSSICI